MHGGASLSGPFHNLMFHSHGASRTRRQSRVTSDSGLDARTPFRLHRHDQTKLGLEKLTILALLTGPITSPRPASPAAISNKSFDYRPARLAGWS
jgi:hypothetical protein